MNLLVVGGTGTLGRQIVKKALDEGYQVSCLVRNLRRAKFLTNWGAELLYGDLTIPETIPPALKNIDVVIDASTIRSSDDYNADKVDWRGKIALIEASKVAKIQKFIFFSLANVYQNQGIPLVDLKLQVEKYLEQSKINYTIFYCSGFFQGLINQFAVPILEEQSVWLLGNGASVAYLDTLDAARAVVTSIGQNNQAKKIALLGEKFWTSEEIILLCERLSGKTANKSYIPGIFLTLLYAFLRCFQFTWNISDRLQFSELTNKGLKTSQMNEFSWTSSRLSLESYFKEYFGKILKKVKETTYQQAQK